MTIHAQDHSPSTADERTEALNVLRASLRQLTRPGRFPTASELRLDMRRRTYGGFDPKELDFGRFRDFLAFAQEQGVVTIDYNRSGDVRVQLVGDDRGRTDPLPPIRADFWRCFVDWNASKVRYYDVFDDKAVIFPREPAPLEPEKYRALRRKVEDPSFEMIEINPIEVKQQLGWMQEFVKSVDEPVLRELLLSALDDPKPLKLFKAALQGLPSEHQRWKRFFSQKVRDTIQTWLTGKVPEKTVSIERRDVVAGEVDEEQPSDSSGDSVARLEATRSEPYQYGSSINLVGVAELVNRLSGAGHDRPRRATSGPEGALRGMLHAAIDRMPLSELRKIEIPVGYLIED